MGADARLPAFQGAAVRTSALATWYARPSTMFSIGEQVIRRLIRVAFTLPPGSAAAATLLSNALASDVHVSSTAVLPRVQASGASAVL